jgi:hypothetical protein
MKKEYNRKMIHWRIVMLIVTLGLVSLVLFQFVFAEETPARRRCEGTEIAMFRTQLTLIPSSEVQWRKNVEGKIDAWETIISICETNASATKNLNTPLVFPTWSPPPFATGIFEGQTGVFHAFEAKIENHWRGIVDGERVFVYAGAWVSDPSQGFIAVHSNVRSSGYLHGLFPSPTKSGALRIIGVKGSRLIIQQANSKAKLFFDVPALTYVGSLDVSVRITPTSSPSPATSTPLPYPMPTLLSPYPAPPTPSPYPAP